jgi:hypothetical protein
MLIDRSDINAIIDDAGSDVTVFVITRTVDMQGDTTGTHLEGPYVEKALIRPRSEAAITTEQGEQAQGDALGYFKYDTKIRPECEVHMEREDVGQGGQAVVYIAISIQPSYFEGQLKFMKAVLQKRRY